jgi:hypothetical protein
LSATITPRSIAARADGPSRPAPPTTYRTSYSRIRASACTSRRRRQHHHQRQADTDDDRDRTAESGGEQRQQPVEPRAREEPGQRDRRDQEPRLQRPADEEPAHGVDQRDQGHQERQTRRTRKHGERDQQQQQDPERPAEGRRLHRGFHGSVTK